MKSLLKKVSVIIVMLLVVPFVFTACGTSSSNNDLKIAVYLGEYGQVWINNIARDFEEEYGVTVEVEASTGLQGEIESRLQNGASDDLYFSHGISWETAAAQNLILPLDDLYESEVEDGVTFEDKIVDDYLETSKMYDSYYKVPYTNGVGGLVYNVKMFEDNGWEVPTTYSELEALCAQIYKAGKVPFAWSSESYYWDYLVFDWWAQIDGYDQMVDYTTMADYSVFNQSENPGQSTALKAWSNLVADHPEYSLEDSAGKIYTAAQMLFVNGNAAMMPNAHWLEQGMTGNIDPNVCVLGMMETPYIDEAAGFTDASGNVLEAKKDSDGEYIQISNSIGAGDSIVIPASAPNPDLAKKFLLFLAKDENMMSFFEDTSGAMLAFDYSNCELPSDATQFMADVWNINKNAQKFNLVSLSPMVLNGNCSVAWPIEGTSYYSTLYYAEKGAGNTLGYDTYEEWVDAKYDSVLSEIISKWDDWNS